MPEHRDIPSRPADRSQSANNAPDMVNPAPGQMYTPGPEASGTPKADQLRPEQDAEIEDVTAVEPENVPKDTMLEPAKGKDVDNRPAVPSKTLRKNSRRRLSDEQIEELSPAELKAVASDRGYLDIKPFMGRSAIRAIFKKAQEKDDTLEAEVSEQDEKAEQDRKAAKLKKEAADKALAADKAKKAAERA